jgi:hypothetical protein
VEFRVRSGARTIWCELRATMTGQAAEAERCLGLIADVTARKSLGSTEHHEFIDALTGLETAWRCKRGWKRSAPT